MDGCRCFEGYIAPGEVETHQLARLVAENARITTEHETERDERRILAEENARITTEYERERNDMIALVVEHVRLTEELETKRDGGTASTDEMVALRERVREAESRLRRREEQHEALPRRLRRAGSSERQRSDEDRNGEAERSNLKTTPLAKNESVGEDISPLKDEVEISDDSDFIDEEIWILGSARRATLERMRRRLGNARNELNQLKANASASSGPLKIDEATAISMLEQIRLEVEKIYMLSGEAIPANGFEYEEITEHVVSFLHMLAGVESQMKDAKISGLESQLELGKTRERELRLEIILRKLNAQAQAGWLKLNSIQPPASYGAAEYILDSTKLIDDLKIQFQASFRSLVGQESVLEVGASEFIQECTMRIKLLNDKVQQNFQFRNASPNKQEEMLEYLQNKNMRLQTEVESMKPEVESVRAEMRHLIHTSLDASFRHASRINLTTQERENRFLRYNFLIFSLEKMLRFIKAIPAQYSDNSLPLWIEKQAIPEVSECSTMTVDLKDIQEKRLQAIYLVQYMQKLEWPGSYPNWISSGKNQRDDENGRALQEILKGVFSAIAEADLELSGEALEDLNKGAANGNDSGGSRVKDRSKKIVIGETGKSRGFDR
ncbi:hypothetical protein EG329_013801 [Mollisiaceae sp. DMI_Dod_QoI]|nr:hypothetical protein EG329_013801 [Helotiales sp. DMI_Dod_QoI]